MLEDEEELSYLCRHCSPVVGLLGVGRCGKAWLVELLEGPSILCREKSASIGGQDICGRWSVCITGLGKTHIPLAASYTAHIRNWVAFCWTYARYYVSELSRVTGLVGHGKPYVCINRHAQCCAFECLVYRALGMRYFGIADVGQAFVMRL